MEKNLAYYMGVPYPVEILEIDKTEGGGFEASIPLLGRFAFLGDGDTLEEALVSLEETKSYLFQKYLALGITIPEPTESYESY